MSKKSNLKHPKPAIYGNAEDKDWNDEKVFSLLLNDDSLPKSNTIANIRTLNHHYPNLVNYLRHRFNDLDGTEPIMSIVYRMLHTLEKHPVCPICGKPLKYTLHFDIGFGIFCSRKCALSKEGMKISEVKYRETCKERYGDIPWKADVCRKKQYETCKERYGVKHPLCANDIKEKFKRTCLARYGVDVPAKSPEIYAKMQATCIERYGVDNSLKSEEVRSKIESTMIAKYGVLYTAQSKELRRKQEETCIKLYGAACNLCNDAYYADGRRCRDAMIEHWKEIFGFPNPMQNQQIIEKCWETRKKNGTCNTSRIEESIHEYLVNMYGKDDVIRQHKEERYRHHADFYISSIDAFIEIQGTWMHGPHQYDPSSIDDVKLVELWKQRYADSNCTKIAYQKAIESFTIADPLKREEAQRNGLKFFEFFPGNFNLNRQIEKFDVELKDFLENTFNKNE